MRVKRAERCRELINLQGLQPAPAQSCFERLILLKPAHDHQPIHDRPVAGDRETRYRDCKWDNAQIDVRGEPLVQQIFCAAGGRAPIQSRKIEIGKANRFLQLVNAFARHEDPGHVGFTCNDWPGRAWIGRRPAKKPDFIVEGRRILASKGSAKPRQRLGRLHIE